LPFPAKSLVMEMGHLAHSGGTAKRSEARVESSPRNLLKSCTFCSRDAAVRRITKVSEAGSIQDGGARISGMAEGAGGEAEAARRRVRRGDVPAQAPHDVPPAREVGRGHLVDRALRKHLFCRRACRLRASCGRTCRDPKRWRRDRHAPPRRSAGGRGGPGPRRCAGCRRKGWRNSVPCPAG